MPTQPHNRSTGSNPGAPICEAPGNGGIAPEPRTEIGPIRASRRQYGTGTLYIDGGRWYGRWRTKDGRRPNRFLGTLAELTRDEADEKLRKLIAGRATYSRRAGRARHDHEYAGVYFIVGGGMVKIGRTDRTPVAVRLERLQRCSPVRLSLHRFVALPFPDAVERALHRRFAEEHGHAEWFHDRVLVSVDQWSDDEILRFASEDSKAARERGEA